jgi:hypothetical protein
MSNRINIIKLPTKNSKDINNNASNLSYTYKQFDCLVSNDINYNVHAEKEIINSSASTYNADDSFERDIDGNHQDDINDINSTKLRDTFLNDTDSETSSLKRRSISSSEYMSDRFKVLVVNQHNGFIPSELQYNEQSSIATIIPANCINQKVNANQRSKLLSISSTASPTAESIAAVGLSIRSSSDASLEKGTSVSGLKSTSSSYVPRNKTTEGDKILLSTQSSSVLALQDLKSSGSRLEVAGSKLKVAGAVSQSLSTSRSTSTTTAISSYSRPKSTHIDDKKELLYAYNMIKILQPQIPQFQSLNLVFDYIATSLYSLNDIIKLDNQNKIQHCLKYPDNLPNIINHLKNMAFLPENYHTLTNLSFLDYIINQSNTTTTSSNLTKSSVGLNITSTGKNSVINHHKISTNSSTSLGKNKMSLESQNFYSINHFESDSKKQKKENVATIGLINIYKTIKKHLETNNIKSKFFSSEDFVLVSEIFNETGLLLFPIINNNNNTFFNSLANKMNVDIMVIENLIIQYIENNKNNPIFLLSVYNPDIGSNENSLLQKQQNFLDIIINFDIKKQNITNLSLPFILQNFSNIFPDYEILLFNCKDDNIKDIFCSDNVELKLFDADKSNSIAIMHYDNVYKLLTNMHAKYMYTNDSDDGEF